jgi:hypothetical protein
VPEIDVTVQGTRMPVRLARIQAFLLDLRDQRLIVLQGSTANYRTKRAHGVTRVEVVVPDEWDETESNARACYGIAKGFTLEELQLRGIDLEL